MRQIQLVGEAYKDESLTFSAQDTVNWIPEPDESGQGRSRWILRGLPGLRNVTTTSGGGGGGGGGGIVVSPVTITGSPPSGSRDAAYTFTFSASGGTAPYTWSTNNSQPNGLTINPATGVLSGTPIVAGDFAFSVSVTDATGLPASLFVTIRITAPSGAAVPIANANFATATDWFEFQEQAVPGWSLQSGAGRSGPGFLRWQSGPLSNTYFGDIMNNSTVVLSDGNPVFAGIYVKCTQASGDGVGTLAACAAGIQVFSDAACTQIIGLPAYLGNQRRFTAPDDWQFISIVFTPTAGTYYRFCVWCGTSVDATFEFDDALWDARLPA